MEPFRPELIHYLVVPLLVRNLSEFFLIEKEPVLIQLFVAFFDRPDVRYTEFFIQSFDLVLLIMVLVVFSEEVQSPWLSLILLNQLHNHKSVQVFVNSSWALLHFKRHHLMPHLEPLVLNWRCLNKCELFMHVVGWMVDPEMKIAVLCQVWFGLPHHYVWRMVIRKHDSSSLHVLFQNIDQIVMVFTLDLIHDRYPGRSTIHPKHPPDLLWESSFEMPSLSWYFCLIYLNDTWKH